MTQIHQTYEADAILPYRVAFWLRNSSDYIQFEVVNWCQSTWGDRFSLVNPEGVWYPDNNIPALIEIWFLNESDATMCALRWSNAN